MRKCTRPAENELTQLNITPLLDLAFVLLVIFIITTAPIVNDVDLNLPHSSQHAKDPPRKANYVTVDASGEIFLNRKPVNTQQLLDELIEMRTADPDLNVIVRGDGRARYRVIAPVLGALERANVYKVDLATDAKPGAKL